MRSSIVGVVLLSLGAACTFPGDDNGDDDTEEPVPPPVDPLPPPPEPTTDVLQKFSGCPELSDLQDTEFAEKWSGLSSSGGNCGNCHITAESGYEPIVGNAATALDQMTTSPDRIRVFFAAFGEDIIIAEHLERASSGQPPYVAHPHYDLGSAGAADALEEVYERAHARYLSDTCGPPRY